MLDNVSKKEILNVISELKKNPEHTIISITHDMDEILSADRVLVMNKGKVFCYDTPFNVLKN